MSRHPLLLLSFLLVASALMSACVMKEPDSDDDDADELVGVQLEAREACGEVTCGAETFCCNASCGICAPIDGGTCTDQLCE